MREQRAILLDDDVSDGRTLDQLVVALAKKVRTIYCTCRRTYGGAHSKDYGNRHMPKWDGGEDAHGTRHTGAVWPKIASAIINCSADPVMFLHAQFQGLQQSRLPAPNTMYSPRAVQRWEDYRDKAKYRLQQQITSDKNQVKMGVLPLTANLKWEYRKALDQVLSNMDVSITPLTRYCLAHAEGLPIAARCREAALLQYMFQISNYDEILGAEIPVELHQDAQQLRTHLTG